MCHKGKSERHLPHTYLTCRIHTGTDTRPLTIFTTTRNSHKPMHRPKPDPRGPNHRPPCSRPCTTLPTAHIVQRQKQTGRFHRMRPRKHATRKPSTTRTQLNPIRVCAHPHKPRPHHKRPAANLHDPAVHAASPRITSAAHTNPKKPRNTPEPSSASWAATPAPTPARARQRMTLPSPPNAGQPSPMPASTARYVRPGWVPTHRPWRAPCGHGQRTTDTHACAPRTASPPCSRPRDPS